MVAASGGLIGIALFDMAVCGHTVMATAEAMRYTADLVGVEHVALGTDFDGAIKAPIDASGMALLTRDLLAVGFSPAQAAQIMGGNAFRFLQENLPPTAAPPTLPS
ncbi:MAG: membrane dipeptidase [Chloroflexi bacterium]|nr:membrane dipeptidase [Chloroflexota bacterium]